HAILYRAHAVHDSWIVFVGLQYANDLILVPECLVPLSYDLIQHFPLYTLALNLSVLPNNPGHSRADLHRLRLLRFTNASRQDLGMNITGLYCSVPTPGEFRRCRRTGRAFGKILASLSQNQVKLV